MTLGKIATTTYADLHPARTVFAPRTTMEHMRRVFSDAYQLESITGVTLSLMGDMPLICHRAVATVPALEFMRIAGLSMPTSLLTYSTEEEALSLARQRISFGERIAYVYYPLPGVNTPKDLLVSCATYKHLNNKSHIPEFINQEYIPERCMVTIDELETLKDQTSDRPVFVKAAVEGVNGGGTDVKYCYDEASWREAISWFEGRQDGTSGLVIEEAIDVRTCWCLGVSILNAECRFLGGAIQLFDKPAVQIGSRMDPEYPVPSKAIRIALIIAERARKKGYRGIAGFDIGVDRHNNLFVFDLNFRLNLSTNQLLLHDAATKRIGVRISQFWQVKSDSILEYMLGRLMPFVEIGAFVPTRLFDREVFQNDHPETEAKSVVTGIIFADTVAEIEELDAGMKQALKI